MTGHLGSLFIRAVYITIIIIILCLLVNCSRLHNIKALGGFTLLFTLLYKWRLFTWPGSRCFYDDEDDDDDDDVIIAHLIYVNPSPCCLYRSFQHFPCRPSCALSVVAWCPMAPVTAVLGRLPLTTNGCISWLSSSPLPKGAVIDEMLCLAWGGPAWGWGWGCCSSLRCGRTATGTPRDWKMASTTWSIPLDRCLWLGHLCRCPGVVPLDCRTSDLPYAAAAAATASMSVACNLQLGLLVCYCSCI